MYKKEQHANEGQDRKECEREDVGGVKEGENEDKEEMKVIFPRRKRNERIRNKGVERKGEEKSKNRKYDCTYQERKK